MLEDNKSLENKKPQNFHSVMSKLLEVKLAQVQKEKKLDSLNVYACTVIYTTIFETVTEILTTGNVQITNESANYLAQQYYDGTLINGRHELDPNIFEKRAKLENIETKELGIVGSLLRGSDFLLPVVAELKKRS